MFKKNKTKIDFAKKSVSVLLLSSLLFGEVSGIVSNAQNTLNSNHKTYKDGVFTGDGSGFAVYNNHNNPDYKIKVNVTFKDDKIEKVDIVGAKDKGDHKYEIDRNLYYDDVDFLQDTAYKIIDFIKSKGLEHIDKIEKDLDDKYHKNYSGDDDEYNVISGATGTAHGIAEAIKVASNKSKEAQKLIDKDSKKIESVKIGDMPDLVKKDRRGYNHTLEGDNLEGLTFNVKYLNGSSEKMSVEDLSKIGLSLIYENSYSETNSEGKTEDKVLSGKIESSKKFKFENNDIHVNTEYNFYVVNGEKTKLFGFRVIVAKPKYYARNIMYRVDSGDYIEIKNPKLSTYLPSVYFSSKEDLKAIDSVQEGIINKSDLGRYLVLKSDKFVHERTLNEISKSSITKTVKISEDTKKGDIIWIDPLKQGILNTENYGFKILDIVDDTDKQKEDLESLIKNIESNKELKSILENNNDNILEKKFRETYENSKKILEKDYTASKLRVLKDELKDESEIVLNPKSVKLDENLIQQMKDNEKFLSEKLNKLDRYEMLEAKDIISNIEEMLSKNPKNLFEIKNYSELVNEKVKFLKKNSDDKSTKISSKNSSSTSRTLDKNDISRISGKDRYDTSIELSKKYFYNSDIAIIASGEEYPDALSANALAASENAPILLVGKNMIKDKTIKELQRLKVKKVIVVGGLNSVSEHVRNKLKEIGDLESIKGENRYETSKLVADRVMRKGYDKNIILADGKSYPDALSGSSLVEKYKAPILLVDDSKEGMDCVNFAKNSGKNIIILGGEKSVSSDIEKGLSNVKRISGKDRYETSRKVFKEIVDKNTVFIADGRNYPDALSAGPVVIKQKAGLVLVNENNETIGQDLSSSYKNNIVAIGGESSISTKILDKLAK